MTDDAHRNDPFGRNRLPPDFDRERRIALLGESASALLAGELPSIEERMFLGGALHAWLSLGGSLERDFLRVVKPKSHHTPARVWARLQAKPEDASS